MAATRALVAGWFSMHRGATVGDVLAGQLVSRWLGRAGYAHDVAWPAAKGEGVDWETVDPEAYSHVIVVCGPAAPGLRITKLIERFERQRLIGIDLSMISSLHEWNPFDVLIERDSTRVRRPDITFVAPRTPVPVVARILAHSQREYDGAMHDSAREAIDRLLGARELAVVPVDTRLPPKNKTGASSAGEVESLIARMDAVVTTRLHGLVLALKNGIPALAIDAIAGGAKVLAQAESVGWPAVFSVDRLDQDELSAALDWCLGPKARERCAECAADATAAIDEVRGELLESLGGLPSATS